MYSTEQCPPEHMAPYLDQLMNKLMQMLQGRSKMVQESALTALASVADNAGTVFAKYYDAVLPTPKQILVFSGGEEHRMLRAKAVDASRWSAWRWVRIGPPRTRRR